MIGENIPIALKIPAHTVSERNRLRQFIPAVSQVLTVSSCDRFQKV